MNYEKLFLMVKPYLEKNEFGIFHTRRVYNVALQNFDIPYEKEELIFCSIILHDVGGSSIREQYEEGPTIARLLLGQLSCDNDFIATVCNIIQSHHNHPEVPSLPFRILYDSDKLVMFSPEEFSFYNSKPNFDWRKVIDLIYSENAKDLAEALLKKRKAELASD